jgi:hypothetical protein
MFDKIVIELAKPIPKNKVSEFAFLLKKHGVQRLTIDPVYRKAISLYVISGAEKKTITRLLKNIVKNFTSLSNSNDFVKQNSSTLSIFYPTCIERLKTSGKIINNDNITQALIDNKWLLLLDNHDFGFQHGLQELFETFDTFYRKLMYDLYPQAKEIQFSPLINPQYLAKINLPGNSPSTHFFVSDENSINSCEKNYEHTLIPSPNLCILQTAPCFKIYQALSNQRLIKNQIYSIRGTCFRNEGNAVHFLERLLSFTMREFVFVGSPDFVLHARDASLQATIEWLRTLEMSAFCQEANDPFFIRKNNCTDLIIPPNIKQEVRALLPYKNDSLAIASFDTHGNFFTKHLAFSVNGEETWTGCIGLGLERAVWAFLQQKGLNTKHWPLSLQKVGVSHDK